MKRRHAFIIALLLTGLISANLYLLDIPNNREEREFVTMTRVIDGDTLEAGDETIRLTNINTPERGRKGYDEAKDYLAQFEEQQVEIVRTGTDKYGRTLARIYVPEYLNLKIVEEGLATKFLVDQGEHELFAQAEQKAIETEKGIWHHSDYFGCLDSEIKEREEVVTLTSRCGELDFTKWIITDESRKEYNAGEHGSSILILHTREGTNEGDTFYWNAGTDVWNNDRDTLYVFDKDRTIVHTAPYGY